MHGESGGGRERVVVIDTGPDFREQALRSRLTHVDAVFYTHPHADHILGLDDLRPLSFVSYRQGGPLPLYAASETASVLERVFDYTFSTEATYPTRARVHIQPLEERTLIQGVEFTCVPVKHGEMNISGFVWRHGISPTSARFLTPASPCWRDWKTWFCPRCATSRIPVTQQ
jgi:phosphoribosyl 1,2-cyclic phosphate phosphodiesterase